MDTDTYGYVKTSMSNNDLWLSLDAHFWETKKTCLSVSICLRLVEKFILFLFMFVCVFVFRGKTFDKLGTLDLRWKIPPICFSLFLSSDLSSEGRPRYLWLVGCFGPSLRTTSSPVDGSTALAWPPLHESGSMKYMINYIWLYALE